MPYTTFRDTGRLLAIAHERRPTTSSASISAAAEISKLRAEDQLRLRMPGRNVSGIVGVSNNNNNNDNNNNNNNNGLEIVSEVNHSRNQKRSRKQRSRKQRSRKQRSRKQRNLHK